MLKSLGSGDLDYLSFFWILLYLARQAGWWGEMKQDEGEQNGAREGRTGKGGSEGLGSVVAAEPALDLILWNGSTKTYASNFTSTGPSRPLPTREANPCVRE